MSTSKIVISPNNQKAIRSLDNLSKTKEQVKRELADSAFETELKAQIKAYKTSAK
jgi:hypothetical protein